MAPDFHDGQGGCAEIGRNHRCVLYRICGRGAERPLKGVYSVSATRAILLRHCLYCDP